jgi:hypothetical protein
MKTILKIGCGIALGVVMLGIIGIILTGTCARSLEEAEKQIKLLPLGQATVMEGIQFTVVEYIVSKEVGGKPPSAEGAQYLFIHCQVENIGEIAKVPPSEYDIQVIYKGEKVEMPLLVFLPSARVGGRELSEYPYFYATNELYPGITKDGWLVYLIPMDFHPEDTKIIVSFSDVEKAGWTLTR